MSDRSDELQLALAALRASEEMENGSDKAQYRLPHMLKVIECCVGWGLDGVGVDALVKLPKEDLALMASVSMNVFNLTKGVIVVTGFALSHVEGEGPTDVQ